MQIGEGHSPFTGRTITPNIPANPGAGATGVWCQDGLGILGKICFTHFIFMELWS
jgi:hypothetical protein